MPLSVNSHYYHLACPLCWQDVDRSQTDSFRLLPLNPEKISWFYENPIFEEPVLHSYVAYLSSQVEMNTTGAVGREVPNNMKLAVRKHPFLLSSLITRQLSFYQQSHAGKMRSRWTNPLFPSVYV